MTSGRPVRTNVDSCMSVSLPGERSLSRTRKGTASRSTPGYVKQKWLRSEAVSTRGPTRRRSPGLARAPDETMGTTRDGARWRRSTISAETRNGARLSKKSDDAVPSGIRGGTDSASPGTRSKIRSSASGASGGQRVRRTEEGAPEVFVSVTFVAQSGLPGLFERNATGTNAETGPY